MGYFLLSLALVGIGYLVWHQMKQNELAKFFIEQRCEQVNVQIVSIARNGFQLKKHQGKWQIISKYDFEFSANGIDCHQGFAILQGMRIKEIYMPAYPM